MEGALRLFGVGRHPTGRRAPLEASTSLDSLAWSAAWQRLRSSANETVDTAAVNGTASKAAAALVLHRSNPVHQGHLGTRKQPGWLLPSFRHREAPPLRVEAAVAMDMPSMAPRDPDRTQEVTGTVDPVDTVDVGPQAAGLALAVHAART